MSGRPGVRALDACCSTTLIIRPNGVNADATRRFFTRSAPGRWGQLAGAFDDNVQGMTGEERRCPRCRWVVDEHDGPGEVCRYCTELEQRQASKPPLTTRPRTRSAPPPTPPYTSRRRELTEVADRSSGQLACPKCGGTQFHARRSNTKRLIGAATVGAASLLTSRSQVQCVTCGAKFKRG
jgi:ribosomal protein S27AE